MSASLIVTLGTHAALISLLICSAGQVLHAHLHILHSRHEERYLVNAYEASLIVHIVIMAAVALALARGAIGNPPHAYEPDSILSGVLWINIAVAVITGYVSLAGLPDVGGENDYAWMAPIEMLLAMLNVTPVIHALGTVWYLVFAIDVVYILIRTVYLIVSDEKRNKRIVSLLSVSEALRRLPEGVVYFDEDGREAYMNDTMRQCLSAMGIQYGNLSIDDFWSQLQSKAPDHRLADMIEETHAETGSQTIAYMTPDEVWLFTFEGLGFGYGSQSYVYRPLATSSKKRKTSSDAARAARMNPSARVIAYDITEKTRILNEIDEMNASLAASQLELQASLETVQEAAENEALLKMRGRVHDVIGQRLSMLHRALEDGDLTPEKIDQLKPLLTGILDDLSHDAQARPDDELAAIVNAFSLAGITVTVSGSLPADEKRAQLFVNCIREGTTNAVKHARSKAVEISIENPVLTIANDGDLALAPLELGTGLTNMMRAVNKQGGQLEIQSETEPFTLTISFPE